MLLIITCHYQAWLHLLTRLSAHTRTSGGGGGPASAVTEEQEEARLGGPGGGANAVNRLTSVYRRRLATMQVEAAAGCGGDGSRLVGRLSEQIQQEEEQGLLESNCTVKTATPQGEYITL